MRSVTVRTVARAACALVTVLAALPAAAQEPYRLPPPVVINALDAPLQPAVSVSPDRTMLVLADRAALPTIAELSEPMLRLAGARINPRTNGPHRAVRFTGITIKRIADGQERRVQTPAGMQVGMTSWSPTGQHLAFTVTTDNGIDLWVADVATGTSSRVAGPLNAALGAPCDWLPDGTALMCRFIPAGRGAAPSEASVPTGPNVHVAEGREAPARTYQDLLQNPHDERLFDYYATSQLGIVAVGGGATMIGEPGVYVGADASPDGRFLLVQRLHRPWSYVVPSGLFPRLIEVWDRTGRSVRRVADLPLGDRIPIRGAREGPRGVHWRPTRPATVAWVEALDGGDPRRAAPHRDRFVMLDVAAAGEPAEFYRTEHRAGGVRWGDRDGIAIVNEFDRANRRSRAWLINPDQTGAAPRLMFDLASEDRYADPGQPLMRPTPGGAVLMQSADGRYLYLSGAGASPEGDRPFFDRLDLRTMRAERLFRSADPYYESVVAALDLAGTRIITSRESQTEVPNYFIRDIRPGRSAAAAPPPRALTAFTDPAPQVTGMRKQLVRYRRADGVQLSGTLYLPRDHQTGTRLPLVLWVYPSEFASADAAGQIRTSPNRFTRVGGASHLFLVTQGYAVLDNPSLPVVGGDTANNSYVRQVVAGAQAAIDHVVSMGVADRARVGVGGHSYGAFTTANLLAHSDLFRTGIARSGAYNRTLTPFGFQNESRTFWEAREVYGGMSPFNYANQINEPILLIHGEADDNSGTFPIQSDRFYAALRGLGAQVTLVTYPNEAHGYAARETLLDCVARMIEWFDRYVKPEAGRAASRAAS